uniref:Putative nucleoporin n=1 Tax=Cupiennius salei TaxID=6928 RepID=T1DCK6_CUPSA
MYSPFAKTPLSAAKKRNKILFPASPRTPGSQNCSFGRSFTNSFIQETANYVIESYGCPLPVLVTEALTLAEKVSDISVKLEPFGYASLVCGRQLLIWKYKLDSDQKTNAHCRELTLPPSDLAHKADLVHLFLTDESKLPSALAVSPEGHVRYWPNINHEGSSVDAVTDLQGQECYSLTSVFPLGCILSTTTSSLVIITPTIGDGHPSVICRTLTLPLGVLAGIGRRVSSFIFGVVPTQTTEAKQLNRVLSVKCSDDEYILYVLSSSTLQKWYVSRKDRKENSDQLVFEADLDQELKQSYADKVFKKDSCLLSGLKTWCLDMQLYLSGVMVLTAGTTHSGADNNIHYALGVLDTSSDLPPQSFSSFCITDYSEKYEEELEEKLLNYKLICPTATSSFVFIFNSEKILCIQMGSHLELNEMDFKSSANLILGSGTCDGLPLFFTMVHGVISFVPSQKSIGDSRIISSMREVSFKEPDSSESTENLAAILRNAMCSYCSGDIEKCEKLIKQILPKSLSDDSELDDAVIALSLGIIDDYPVSDPRWCESVPTDSVSSSLIISYQLQDKLKAHDYLLNFLKAFGLFDKLSTSKIGDVIIPTNVLLCEHAEKLVAAKAIRLFLTDHHELIENAVRDSLDKRGIEVKNHLTPQDVFFREVSSFHTIFPSLIEWEMEELYEDESLTKILNVVMTVNKIFVGLLDAITEYRDKNGEVYGFQNLDSGGVYLPWTGRDGNTGIRSIIQKQLFVNLDHTLKLTDSIQIQGVLYQQYVDILNFYVASYKSQLDSLKSNKQAPLLKEYEKERSTFIKPLLAVEQYERAAAIAEKYLDFDILIQICEETQSGDRLQRYMLQFADQKFSEFVFKWYLNKGQRGKIFHKHLGQKEELGNFLQSHDNLKWLYYIQQEQYESAHVTLKQLALKETEYLNRKKTLLSLSKLVSLVSDIPEDTKRHQIEGINLEQDLIIHQEALPVSTVEAFGLDPSNMRVFQPEELIEMYITDENASANAYDFKIALDLLNFMKKPLSDPEVNNIRIHIWCKAILKDNWEELDTNNPLEAIKETIFFQIIELAFDQGVEMHDFIPDVEELLLSPELSQLADNPSFKFLIQAGYEHIMKIID